MRRETIAVAGIGARSSRLRWVQPVAWAATIVIAVGLGYAVRRPVVAPVVLTEAAELPVQHEDSFVEPAPSEIAAADARTRRVMRAAPPAAPGAADLVAPQPPPTGQAIAGNAAAAAEQLRERSVARTDSLIARPPATAAAADAQKSVAAAPPLQQAPPPVAGLGGGGRGGRGGLAARSITTSGLATDPTVARLNIAPPDSISFPDAVRLLGGSLKLIDGMVPLRLEVLAGEVRVVYPLVNGQLVLAQRIIDGRLSWHLIAPPNVSADSLDRLRARVRE